MWRFNPLGLCLWGWMKSEVYKRKVDTRNELFVRIMDAAARIKQREDQLRRTTRDPRTRVTKFRCLSFKHEIKTKIKLIVTNLPSFVTFHNAFVFAGSNSPVSLTIQN